MGPGAQTARLMLYGLLAVVLMAMDHRGQYVSRARDLAQYAVEPVYHLVEWPVSALRNLFGQFQSQRSLRHENERLHRQLLGQQGRLQRMQTLVEENQRLRALFAGAESQPYDYLFAELLQVELDPFAHQVLIDLFVFDLDPRAAVGAPRVHHQWQPDQLTVDADLAADVRAGCCSAAAPATGSKAARRGATAWA